MARLFKTNGDVLGVSPENGVEFTLEELQSIVGGGIEVVHLSSGELMVIDEDHLKKGRRLNGAATYLYERGTGCNDMIHGDALICEEGEVE